MSNDRQLVETEILDLSHAADGIADFEGQRVFVPGALPGERARVALRSRRRRYRAADLVEIVRRAPGRTEPGCEYFGRCGGCAIQHLGYAGQVAFKEDVVREALRRVAGVEPATWFAPLVGPQWHYRRKARLGVRYVAAKDRVLVGFKERGSRFVTDMLSCPVLVKPMDLVPGALSEAIARTSLSEHLPQAEVAVGDSASAVVLRLLKDPQPSDLSALADLGRSFGFDVYLQRGGPGTVRPLDGDAASPLSYRLERFGVTLEFAPTDFIQVNGPINAALVDRVVELLNVGQRDEVLDLYCGLGNFSLPLARRAAAVTGVEGDAGLVARAARNAELNGIVNARFLTADLNEPDWPFLQRSWDCVLLDPPRSGAQEIVKRLKRMAPKRVVYVSCHPATLARDARELTAGNLYRLAGAGIADMFPNTHHVEAIALFER